MNHLKKGIAILLLMMVLFLQGCSIKNDADKETFLSIPEYNEKYSSESSVLGE